MLHRLAALFVVIVSSAWIAGYVAIVLPVIIGRMKPGGQNGNFTMWADAGWIFFVVIALCLSLSIAQLIKQRRFIAIAVIVLLTLSLAMFQYRGRSDTYIIAEAFERRHGLQEQSKQYQDIDRRLQIAHKSSERSIGTLLLILLVCIGFAGAQLVQIRSELATETS